MTLRSKILLVIGCTLVGLGASLYGISVLVLDRNFRDYEQVDAIATLQSTSDRIEREAQHLNEAWLDWSRWDEMYKYVKTGNPKVINSSLTPVQFQDNQINLIAVLNLNGEIIFSTNYNLKTGQKSAISNSTKVFLQDPKWRITQTGKRLSGIVKIDNQPMLVIFQPILRSNAQAPISGSLLVGKFLDLAYFDNLKLPVTTSVELINIPNLGANSNPDSAIALNALKDSPENTSSKKATIKFNQQNQSVFIQPLGSDRLVSNTLLTGLDRSQSFLLRVEMPRLQYERVTQGLTLLVIIVGVGSLIFCAIVYILFEKLVLSQLQRISKDVQKIGSQGDLSKRLTHQSNDEIGELVNTLNTMLEAIAYRHSVQIQVEQEKEILLNINQAISSASDFEAALGIALEHLGEITNSTYGEIWTVSADGMVLNCDAPWYYDLEQTDVETQTAIKEFRDFSEGITLLPNEELPGQVWQLLQPKWKTDLQSTLKYPSMRQELALKCGFTSHICLPIIRGEDPNTVSPSPNEDSIHRDLIAIFSFFAIGSIEADSTRLKLLTDMITQLGGVLRQKQTEAELKALFAAMDDVIMVTDSQGYYLKIAPTNTSFLAQSPAQLLGKRIHDVFEKEKADEFLAYIRRSLNTNQRINPEYTLSLNGKIMWFAASISPITEDSVMWVIRDISDRKATEFALQKALESAKVASRAKSEFLSNMSHELRTPLNAILGFTQLISCDGNLASEQQERLQIISRSGEHLLSLINDVLEMSKIESGKSILNSHAFDLHRLLQDLRDMLRLRAESKGLYLQISYDPQVPQYIHTDEMKLRQVLINILGNGIKFTQIGGVSLTTVCESISDGELHLKFMIKDTGYGIAAEEVDHIFDAFIQTESGRKSSEGTGLGLPISRTFVKMMGGDIQVKSVLAEGTVFSFDIHTKVANLPNQVLAQVRNSEESKDSEKIRDKANIAILLAEDNLVNQKVALQMLKRLGYKADVVVNGLEVLKKIETQSYDLILMDVQMPEMDGIQATIAIREREINLQNNGQESLQKIIAMTANAMVEDRDRCLEIGMNDHLSKPVRLEELKACIEKWIGQI
jgi:PAS domain S-box-containing protein